LGEKGTLNVIEYNFVYNSSMSNYNMGTDLFGYTAVVDGLNLNLTPLGK
jgi:hypothetical protein